MKKSLIVLFIIGLLVLPVASLAYTTPSEPGAVELDTIITNVLTIMWEIAFAAAVIMFIVAGIMFAMSGGAPEKVSTARSTALFAIVGVVVAVVAFSLSVILPAVWGG